MIEEKLLVSGVLGYPELYFLKVFANIIVYLTAKPKLLERSHYIPLLRLTEKQIWGLPRNMKTAPHCSFLKVGAPRAFRPKKHVWSDWRLIVKHNFIFTTFSPHIGGRG